MTLFEWSDAYSIGIPEVDSQHRRLVSLLNGLHAAMSGGQGIAVLKPLLASLIEYTRTHFAAEERMMQADRYPALAAHRAEHESLSAKVAEFQRSFESGQVVMSVQVMLFLKHWLAEHILGTDRKYAEFARGRPRSAAAV